MQRLARALLLTLPDDSAPGLSSSIPASVLVVMLLLVDGPSTTEAIAKETGLSWGAAWKWISLAVKLGGVERVPDPADKRRHTVQLSAKGQRFFKRSRRNKVKE